MRIGIDIGGMTIKLGLVDENYTIIGRKVINTGKDYLTPEEIVNNISEAVKSLLKEYGVQISECESIGIAMPGASDGKTGYVIYSNNIAWENIPLIPWLERTLDIPMGLANDADAAALGEVLAGAAKGHNNAVLLTLGTGVGGGVIIERKIFNGPLRGGCELGHMVIRRDGKLCSCGRKGCLEAYASATALMEQAKEAAIKHPHSMLNELCGGNLLKLDGKMIFQAEQAGDKAAREVVGCYEEDLSIGIANLINIFRPEIVILGGGISAQKKYLTDALQKKVSLMCFGGVLGEIPQIVTSNLGNDAGIIGAAYLI